MSRWKYMLDTRRHFFLDFTWFYRLLFPTPFWFKDAAGDTLSSQNLIPWDAIPFHFLSLPRITHAAAEDGDLGETCGLDLGLSVFPQPTTWSDRLKLAMKHYVLLSLGKVRKVSADTGRTDTQRQAFRCFPIPRPCLVPSFCGHFWSSNVGTLNLMSWVNVADAGKLA